MATTTGYGRGRRVCGVRSGLLLMRRCWPLLLALLLLLSVLLVAVSLTVESQLQQVPDYHAQHHPRLRFDSEYDDHHKNDAGGDPEKNIDDQAANDPQQNVDDHHDGGHDQQYDAEDDQAANDPQQNVDDHHDGGGSEIVPPQKELPGVNRPRQLSGVAEAVGPDPWWRSFLCGGDKAHLRPPLPDDSLRLPLLLREVEPARRNKNVFLVDTACNTHSAYRAWCSIESWASQNPEWDVWLVLTSLTVGDDDRLVSGLLRRHPNLQVVGVDLDLLFRDLPIQQLFDSRAWAANNTWPVELLSDMMRVALLWRWGGAYSDTDVLAIKSLTLPLNAVGYESHVLLGSAFYSFHAGHKYLWSLMTHMVAAFDPVKWGSIGPHAVTHAMEKMCGVKEIRVKYRRRTSKCGDVTLYPTPYFYPVKYENFALYTDDHGGNGFEKHFKRSYLLHVWNKLSKTNPVKVGGNSVYEMVARRVCPFTYHWATLRATTI